MKTEPGPHDMTKVKLETTSFEGHWGELRPKMVAVFSQTSCSDLSDAHREWRHTIMTDVFLDGGIECGYCGAIVRPAR
jgi:hypothetical protein